jgi:hypothetical protein
MSAPRAWTTLSRQPNISPFYLPAFICFFLGLESVMGQSVLCCWGGHRLGLGTQAVDWGGSGPWRVWAVFPLRAAAFLAASASKSTSWP